MKVMISQGMNGRRTADIEEERNKAKEKLNKLGIDVIDTIFDAEHDHLHLGVWYLHKSIEAMSDVNAVVFLGDWRMYRGCVIEHTICQKYGIKILYDDFLDFDNEKRKDKIF